MTTNAIDQKNKVIACDSRWSIQEGTQLFFVDDTGFNKIIDRPEGSLICAGDAQLIESWQVWFRAPGIPQLNATPDVERMQNGVPQRITLTVVQKPDGAALFSKGGYLPHGEHVFFAGSGAQYARDCYSVNQCSKRSIATAALHDPLTGGETKYVELATNVTNLESNPVGMQDAYQALVQRGHMMDITTRKIVPINGASNDSTAAAVHAALSGDLPLSAPAGAPISVWTQTEINDLNSALSKLFEKEEA